MNAPELTAQYGSEGREAFRTHLKPYVFKLLAAIGLDLVYSHAEGDTLYTVDETGHERAVLDMLGGFGAALFGHNHPELLRCAHAVLNARRPFTAQASIRAVAGLLAQRLSAIVGRTTGQQYIVTLANTGTEGVEAAIKHAELERTRRTEAILASHKRMFRHLRREARCGRLIVPQGLFASAQHALSAIGIRDLESLESHLMRFNQAQLETPSRFLAIRGAFHGKTTGALKLTHNAEFREPWHRLGLDGRFVPADDEDALRHEVDDARCVYYEPSLSETGELRLEPRRASRLCACLIEPIQGEGGIREISAAFMRALRAVATAEGFPLVIDEIQSGMGRTGEFLASSASGVAGDYYVLSKSLGGGLAKISALLVRSDRYLEDFAYLHTSTFAEDDFSCAIALAALDLVERDEGTLMRGCREKGDYLLRKLGELQQRYPQVIKDVRGRGLMIGVELHPQLSSGSSLLRVASEQHLLGFLLSGYLLNEEGVRVAPTLSATNTVRLEPSAYIAYGDLDRTCAAFERATVLLARADAHGFLRFMVRGPRSSAASVPPAAVERPLLGAVQPERGEPEATPSRRVGFISHLINPLDLLHWDPSLAPLTEDECSRLLDTAGEVLEPFVGDKAIVRSIHAGCVALDVIVLPMTAQQFMAHLRGGRQQFLLDQIDQAVEIARELGCTHLGFGGYTSIATDNCCSLAEDAIALTSGNSLTAAAAIEATHRAAKDMGIDLATAQLGVVGGLGNIGRVLAEIEAEEVASIVLAGRPGAERRLERVADSLYEAAWQRVLRGDAQRGLACSLLALRVLDRLDLTQPRNDVGAMIRRACAELGEVAPIRISTQMSALAECDLVICASNAPEPIVHPEHLGAGRKVICDVAVPADVHPAVAEECEQVLVLKGGIIQLSTERPLRIGGMALPGGQAYACMAESVLMGLANVREHFSYGALEAARVREIRRLAAEHGFEVLVKPAGQRALTQA